MCFSVAAYIANTLFDGTSGNFLHFSSKKSYTSKAKQGNFPCLPPINSKEPYQCPYKVLVIQSQMLCHKNHMNIYDIMFGY